MPAHGGRDGQSNQPAVFAAVGVAYESPSSTPCAGPREWLRIKGGAGRLRTADPAGGNLCGGSVVLSDAKNDCACGHLIALAVAIVLALGVVACGSDDNANSNGADTSTDTDSKDGGRSGSTASGTSGSPQRQIKAAYAQYIDARYTTKRYEQACAIFSTAMRERYPREAGYGKTCVDSMQIEARSRTRNPERARVVKVNLINNDTATAYVKDITIGHPPIPLRFIKQKGAWKLDGAAR